MDILVNRNYNFSIDSPIQPERSAVKMLLPSFLSLFKCNLNINFSQIESARLYEQTDAETMVDPPFYTSSPWLKSGATIPLFCIDQCPNQLKFF